MEESRFQIILLNQGGTMKLEFEDSKFVIYLMVGMMALGFMVMLLV